MNMKILHAKIEDLTETQEWTKGQLMPFNGWPGGVDPYPKSSPDEVVMMARYSECFQATGEAVSDRPANLGEAVEIDGRTYFITESKNHLLPDYVRILFKAVYHAPINSEVAA